MRKNFLVMVLCMFILGCVEPMEIETGIYEDALVVQGTITSERTSQEIFLSRTFRLEESGPSKERNAQVRVVSGPTIFEFQEAEPGKYISLEPFRAQEGVEYTLEITTSNGRRYSSEPEELPQGSNLSSLYAEKAVYDAQTGLAILLDMKEAGETSGYYRYQYTETYKIISPFIFNLDLQVIDGEFVEFFKNREETICYTTEASKEILLANTNVQTGNDLEAFLIKFMNREDFRTSYRYSIQVKQHSISEEAYSYYETLQDFSNSENLFSQNQLGLINGNIFSVENSSEPVIGIFSVSQVSSKRIFLNFEDFYSRNNFIPNSHVECEVQFPPTATPQQREWIGDQLENGSLKYLGYEVGESANLYRFIKAGCVDCTIYGTTTVPDFWEE